MNFPPSEKRNFVTVDTTNSAALKYIKYKIPAKHKVFADVWHIHQDYVPVILNFFNRGGFSVDGDVQGGYTEGSSGRDFAALYLTKDAPDFLIKAAWKALAAYYHPDAETGCAETFLKISKAYNNLKGN